jgi:hypothetical protein
MHEYIKECTELLEYSEYNYSKAVYKDAKTFHKNMIKLLKFELFWLKIGQKLSNLYVKTL